MRPIKETYYNGKVGHMHRLRKDLNHICPVCSKPLAVVRRSIYEGEDVKKTVTLSAQWLFINRSWGIEFCVHPKCKPMIHEKSIFKYLDRLGIEYQDHLLAIALDTKRGDKSE